MSADRFFDNLARTLASPMPRRRAVRVIGASLVAVAVRGISPPRARAFSDLCEARSGKLGSFSCSRSDRAGNLECKYCGFPFQRYQCLNYKCVDGCETVTRATGKKTKATWSAARDPNGRPLRFECCPIPDTIAFDGECLPNCSFLYRGAGYEQCGRECCPPGTTCKNVQGKQTCVPCVNTCRPQNGKAICCARREHCCFNDTTAACCGPKQTCKAAKVKQATCECKSGKKCGSDCCGKNETCCDGELCCEEGDLCCGGECCDGGLEVCYVSPGIKACLRRSRCVPPLTQCGNYCCDPGNTCRKLRGGRYTCA